MTFPNFSFENNLWKKGYKFVAGVDEVGRGCLAGSVVAGCVVFASNTKIPKEIRVNDSKKLTAKQREKSGKWIKENALAWGIGEASNALINHKGMARATKTAFRKAIKAVNEKLRIGKVKLDYLLIDAFFIPHVPGLPTKRRKNKKGRYLKNPNGRQTAIVHGDEISFSIAAASIIAKVYRDTFMKKLSRKYPKYGWERNKGYGTKEHQEAIKKYGITRFHRKLFVRNII